MKTRTAKDSMGEIQIPKNVYYDAQTARSLKNFKIGTETMPIEVIHAYAIIKHAAALTNKELKNLDSKKEKTITKACEEIILGKLNNEFPVKVWQTGSGTHTNMNVNEVIASRANEILGGKKGSNFPIHPNDDVNMGQSSNDTFPTAMHISAILSIKDYLIPNVSLLQKTLAKKVKIFRKIIKIGRTHMMDATPLTLGQEFSAYSELLSKNLKRLKHVLEDLSYIPIGGTAVGTGLNTKKGFDTKIIKHISRLIGHTFKPARSIFAEMSAHDPLLAASGAMELLACSLMKIAQDIRLLASGPRCGIGEILIPANEPGSSIMPGKVNPTQAEAVLMVGVQVKGCHRTIIEAGNLGELQLNIGKPVIIYNLLQEIRLLADVCKSFNNNCVSGIKPNKKQIKKNLENSLMLVTALNKHIGYDKAAKIAKKAYEDGVSLKEATVSLKILSAKEFENIIQPEKMIGPE